MNLFKLLIPIFLVGQILFASNDPAIIVLSVKVGSSIDAAENALMDLFPDVKGFESAQFYKLSENLYMAKIIYIERTRRKIKKRRYSWRQFQKLKYKAGSHPAITDDQREQQMDYLTYLRSHNIIEDISPSTFCTLKHENGQSFKGTFIQYDNRIITLQAVTKRIEFPIEELKSISYRPFVDDAKPWKKWLAFGLGAFAGASIAEVWNAQKSPRIDIVWHNRFLAIGVGLLFGGEIFEAVSTITSPVKIIALTPEELAKIN